MRRKTFISGLSIGFCILLWIAAIANIGFAQNSQAPQQPYDFSLIQVKPGMDIEFEELVKNSIPALKAMGLTQMDIYKTANFGMANKYVVVTPLREPAAMDAELAASESNVPVGLIPVISALSRTVDSIQDFMLIPQPDLSIPPAEGYNLKLVAAISVRVASGRDAEFRKALKEVVSAIGKTNVKGVLVGKVGMGGNLDEYAVDILYDSFAEMAKNDPAIQKEMAAVNPALLAGVVSSLEGEVFVRLPKLAIQPAGR